MITRSPTFNLVAPFVGVWIEIQNNETAVELKVDVAPFVGVWIEIFSKASIS